MKLIKCNWSNKKSNTECIKTRPFLCEYKKIWNKIQNSILNFASTKCCDFANFRKICKMLKISRSPFTKYCSREFFSSQRFAKLSSHEIWLFKSCFFANIETRLTRQGLEIVRIQKHQNTRFYNFCKASYLNRFLCFLWKTKFLKKWKFCIYCLLAKFNFHKISFVSSFVKFNSR